MNRRTDLSYRQAQHVLQFSASLEMNLSLVVIVCGTSRLTCLFPCPTSSIGSRDWTVVE